MTRTTRPVSWVTAARKTFESFPPGAQSICMAGLTIAAEIITTLDRQRLSVRQAHAHTGIAAADFSRIRNADLGRFTLDRLVGILNRLGSRVDVKVKVKAATTIAHAAPVGGKVEAPALRAAVAGTASMKTKPVPKPPKPDEFSLAVGRALRRAARRARETARMHGTPIYISKHGKVIGIKP